MPTTEPPIIPKINVKVPSTQNYQAAQIRANWKAIRARLTAVEAAAGIPKSVSAGITGFAIEAVFNPLITELIDGMIISFVTTDEVLSVGEYTFTPNAGSVSPAPVIVLIRELCGLGPSTLFPGELGNGFHTVVQWSELNGSWFVLNPLIDMSAWLGNTIAVADPVSDINDVLAIPVITGPLDDEYNPVKTVSLSQLSAKVMADNSAVLMPPGGSTGQSLMKASDSDNDTYWGSPAIIPLMAGGFNEDIIYGVGDNKVPNFMTTTDGDLVYVGI